MSELGGVHRGVQHRWHRHGDLFCVDGAQHLGGKNFGSTIIGPPFVRVGTKNAAPACDSGVHNENLGYPAILTPKS